MSDEFDMEASRRARDAAMARVWRSSDPEWKAWARRCVMWTADQFEAFTSDDVWQRSGLAKPSNARALGPIMTSLRREGYIEKTGDYVQTAQVSRNAAPVALWRKKE